MTIPVQQSEEASWIQPPEGILSLTVRLSLLRDLVMLWQSLSLPKCRGL